ncbi:hypothetical protein [Dokdonella sp.]|uniref:hypothetical protein n=1 Tax=Dokdonella sp. TaxID=2291710 RepID=UPI003C6EE10A
MILVFATSIESRAGVVIPDRPALHAHFDNKAVGQPIGIRGAMFGEPIGLSGLDAAVVEVTPGHNLLRISNDLSTNGARRSRWQMMGNAEIIEGEARISFDLTASARDSFSILVRESISSSKSFLSLSFSASGSITASDANGSIGTASDAYFANAPLHVDLVFDMDARTSTIILGGTTLAKGRAFGIADRGIGAVLFGYSTLSSGSSFDLDNLTVSGTLPFPVALEADFEDKTAGLPIGMGGASLHEPHARNPGLDAVVIEEAPGVNILDMASTDDSTTQVLRWQFLDDLEVRSGLFILDFDAAMTARDRYGISLRERTSSAQTFMSLSYQSNGTMAVSDNNGTAFFDGVSYDAGRVYQYRVSYDMDAGIYEIFRDGIPLIRERAHGVTSNGIGGLLYSISNGALSSSHLQIDSLRIYLSNAEAISADLEFLQEPSTGTENQPVTPGYQVGVVNILDQPVPDGTPVTLEIASGSGPAGAALAGATSATTAGVATFAALTFDMPGTYRLVARSLDATRLNNVDMVVEQSDVLFADGFEEATGIN